MYQYYSLVTLTLNISGGAEITLEKCTKEVDGKVVPCTKAESIFKMDSKIASVGGNKATQSIKCILIDPKGNIFKIEEVDKSAE